MASNNLIGYGTPARNLIFTGEESNYEVWEMRFTSYLRLHKLHKYVMTENDDLRTEPVLRVQTAALTTEERTADLSTDAEKNAEVFAALVQFLDDKSVSLIIRDARNNGRAALKILRDHYKGSTKPRIISIYCELTSLKLSPNETVTEYILRAETCAARLKETGETVSDSLLIAMILKGLPDTFSAFSSVICQQDQDKMVFSKFKSALRNYEENEKARSDYHSEADAVMTNKFQSLNVSNSNKKWENKPKVGNSSNVTCFTCKQAGHKSFQCPDKPKKWCNNCKNSTHDTKFCRKSKHSSKLLSHEEDNGELDDNSFIFKVSELDKNIGQNISDEFLVDCGATAHIVTEKEKFIEFDQNFDFQNHTIELADSTQKRGLVQGKGKAKIYLTDISGKKCPIILEEALFIPSYKQDILSVSKLTKNGIKVYFGPDLAFIETQNGTKFKIEQKGKLYYVNNIRSVGPKERTLQEWHNVMGHLNKCDCINLEGSVEGMKISSKSDFKCSTCIQGKMVEYRNHSADEKVSKPLELVHSDLAGPITPCSKEGSKYAILFTDDFSGVIFVYFLRNKNDATKATAKFLSDVSPYGTIKRLRTDGGTEYTCKEFQNLLIENKIHHEKSSPYSPHQNGTAERQWRTLFEMARCLLLQSDLPKNLWNHALRTSAYIRNRCFVKRLSRTPFEAFTKQRPNIKNMHIFGTDCYAYKQNVKKLDAKAELGKFVGYDYNSPAYLVYFGQEYPIRRVRCVEFIDDCDDEDNDVTRFPILTPNDNAEVKSSEKADDKNVLDKSEIEVPSSQPENERRYPNRTNRNPPKYLGDYVQNVNSECNANDCIDYFYKVNDIPTSYNEAVGSVEAPQWQLAMEEEILSLQESETYELVPRPNSPVLGGRWVYAKKYNEDEEIFKARFVAKGYAQVPQVQYTDTFSPTARLTSIRLLMNIAADENLVVHAMDFKCAYLNADIDCEIFMEQPKGFEVKSDKGDELVLKLKKSLYGLKQSGRMWNNLLHSFLVGLGFVRSEAENCVYVSYKDEIKIIIIVWVDDLIIAGSDLEAVEQVKTKLKDNFKMKDFNTIREFLGIEFEFDDDHIKLHQAKYAEKILKRFNMFDCNIKKLPCDPSITKLNDADSKQFVDNTQYRSMVGSLVYLTSCTRPDLTYIVTKLSEKLECPTQAYLNACKFVLRYLRGTIEKGLVYKRSSNGLKLVGYSDSDFGSSSDRKSFSGYCFQMSPGNSFISWKTKKQPIVTLSTCEAEYVAANYALQEGIFLVQLLTDLGYPGHQICLYVDNKGAIDLSKNPVHHNRSKHIDIRYHFIRQKVQDGSLQVLKVASDQNFADVFTKPPKIGNLHQFHLFD